MGNALILTDESGYETREYDVKTIAAERFKRSYIKNATFPDCLEMIRENAFADNQYLEEVVIDHMISIDIAAFKTNTALRKIDICADTIPMWCFAEAGIRNIEGVDITLRKVKSIGFQSFFGAHIKSIEFPNTFNAIFEEAFGNAIFEEKVLKLPEGITFIGSGAFDGSNLTDIYVPDTLKHISDLTECGIKIHMSPKLFEKLNLELNENIIIESVDYLIDKMSFKNINKMYLESNKNNDLNKE